VDQLVILGCRLDTIDAGEATTRVLAFARQPGAAAQVVTLGTEMVVLAQHDETFRSIVNGCSLSLCDTVGLLTVARRRGATLRERVTGIELTERVCEAAAREGLSVYFLGGAEGVAADAAAILEARFPGLRIAGDHNGYFTDEQNAEVVAGIRASGANMLFVGMGSPRQEVWLADHLRDTGCSVGVGVGGSFDVLGGRIERAPQFYRRYGLEWLYRLGREPHRWRRQLALPYFVWLVVLDGLGFGHKKGAVDL
jgi:N-acetylglucosaminyldiphosphoundecaprenol N-acetyl-beta-D-mannosaminyltransferase